MFYFNNLENLNNLVWIFSLIFIFFSGFFLTFKSNFFQLKFLSYLFLNFFSYFNNKQKIINFFFSNNKKYVYVFFTSLCTTIGVGNLVTISFAIKIGGPGAVFWMWVISFFGMIIKFSEINLGIKFSKELNSVGIFSLLKKINSKTKIFNILYFLFFIYCCDIYIFNIIKENLFFLTNLNEKIISVFLIFFIFFIIFGGITRIGKLSTYISVFIFFFLFFFFIYISLENFYKIPKVLFEIFYYSLNPCSILGGFLGSSVLNTIVKGSSSICYSSDIGIGCSSILYSELDESKTTEYKSNLGMLISFIDGFIICNIVSFIILFTEVWKENSELTLISLAFKKYFLYSEQIMSFFLVLLGISTLTSYLYVGIKALSYLFKKKYKIFFILYVTFVLFFFSHFKIYTVLCLINIFGGFLIIFNIPLICYFYKNINFKIDF